MITNLTSAFLMTNRGCYSREEIANKVLRGRKSLKLTTFIKDNKIPFKDRCWFLVKKCELTNRQKVRLAVGLAEVVLPIFEDKTRSKKLVEAIVLVNKWLLRESVCRQELGAAHRDASDILAVVRHAYFTGDSVAYDVVCVVSAACHVVSAACDAYDYDNNTFYRVDYDAYDAAYATSTAAANTAYKSKLESFVFNFIKEQSLKY